MLQIFPVTEECHMHAPSEFEIFSSIPPLKLVRWIFCKMKVGEKEKDVLIFQLWNKGIHLYIFC